MGIAVPREYAMVITNASNVTVPVIARDMTEARMGPTHGVQSSPSENPINRPGANPDWILLRGRKPDNLENIFSIII
ncbi:hypothetical protein A2229_02340 [Candidatus Peregrinibacteria bacterium RIFOXYA2_FULL_33_7]|nr:MAG: hypothetical protein A2229_02340 [Candidatus Peregrinibacteria bacterium RIFOXYA2_FULL_33_7]